MEERQLAPIVVNQEPNDLIPTMVMDLAVAKQNWAQLRNFVQSVMVKDQDYGVIPGTEKPTLLKNGAEKLLLVYGLAPTFEIVDRVEDWERGFFRYVIRCSVISKRTGRVVAQGIGECNSKEKRYGDRWVYRSDVPLGLNPEDLETKEYTSKAGKPYLKYKVPNPDIFSLVNTLLKMAQKRALVAATLSATAASDLFTQDMEDIKDNTLAFGDQRDNFGSGDPRTQDPRTPPESVPGVSKGMPPKPAPKQETPKPTQQPKLTNEQIKQYQAELWDRSLSLGVKLPTMPAPATRAQYEAWIEQAQEILFQAEGGDTGEPEGEYEESPNG